MLTPNKFHDPARHQANREKFAGEMEYRASKYLKFFDINLL
jgi:hypothetical protein